MRIVCLCDHESSDVWVLEQHLHRMSRQEECPDGSGWMWGEAEAVTYLV